ncbi:MAG: hypothetical protein A3I31_02695 [Candidatus Colwellbacteria bacterium RIFCSPLOWO2_02_FULL_44_20b]|uniref:Ribulose-phosphate 3-epimerase n=1 Tax=Candidatus Colwellbacteria bacterium RIFCSPLOWO2_02_FULL_44_20b TaxID=1797691 RepID=A0A1G1Z7W5_9BACT|nr:MAG: hypothetical protein A3I31_02695 [Candidatus Colwellbacteria bacterium RIFCSPLOWO2_02_FULL_44_20b]
MIIPAINCQDYKTAQKLATISLGFLPAGGWLHLDAADGVFTPAVTWGSPSGLKELIASNSEFIKLNFEAHLMVHNPEEILEEWLQAGVKRVIIHQEPMKNPKFILDLCKQYSVEAMLSIMPRTSRENFLPYLRSFPAFQVLAVSPGYAGQKFGDEALELLKFLRARVLNATIEVDGGISFENAGFVKSAGADLLTSASYIFNSPDPKTAYEDLTRA